MEGDRLCLDLALLYVDLVASEDDWDVLADTDQITWELLVTVLSEVESLETYGASWERSCM